MTSLSLFWMVKVISDSDSDFEQDDSTAEIVTTVRKLKAEDKMFSGYSPIKGVRKK